MSLTSKSFGFGNFNEIEMFDVLLNVLKFEYEDLVKMTPECYAINEDLSNARKELLIFLMQCKERSELNELLSNDPLIGLIEKIDDDYLEAISNSCVLLSQLVVKIIESSEKCVEYLKYLKSNIPKPKAVAASDSPKSFQREKIKNTFTKQLSVTSFFPVTNQLVIETPEPSETSELPATIKTPPCTTRNVIPIKKKRAYHFKSKIFIKKEAKIPISTLRSISISNLNNEIEESFKHFKLVGGHKLFVCQKCSYEANDKNNFREHLLKHFNYKRKSLQFKCRYCDYHGANSFFLKKHERDYHKNVYQPRKVVNSKNIHHCTKCPFSARTRINLNSHMKHHQFNKNHFKCRYCDFYLEYFKKMSSHEVIHPEYEPIAAEDKFVKCTICPYKTLKSLSFKVHMQNHVKKNGKVKCRYCDYYLTTLARVRDHEKLHPEFEETIC